MVEYYKIEREILEATADRCRTYIGNDKKFPTEETPVKIDEVYAAGADVGYDTGLDHGKQAERDAFWDSLQDNGNRTHYGYGFAGDGWNNYTFKPKYDIRPSTASALFYSAEIEGDFVELLSALGITLDLSNATNLSSAFATASSITRLGVINTSSATTIATMFSNCTNLVTIDKLILKSDGSQIITNLFIYCPALENLTIEGVIGNDIDLQWSTGLSKASIESVIYALSRTVSGKTLTLSKTAVDNAYAKYDAEFDYTVPGSGTGEWSDVSNVAPNWTITLV